MKVLFSFLAICALFSCNNDDIAIEEEEACVGVIDFAPSTFFLIELVDENGTNLVENDYYQEDLFALQLNGLYWNDGIRVQDNIITLFPAGSAGDNRYLIYLSENEIDTVDFNLSFVEVRSKSSDGRLFCGEKIVLNSASYNQIDVDTTKVSRLPSSNPIPAIPITIVKSTD